jgi:hypothetical protein
MMIAPDHMMEGVDPRCDCGGDGDSFHRDNVRCQRCPQCGDRIKGIYWMEHIGVCFPRKVRGKNIT